MKLGMPTGRLAAVLADLLPRHDVTEHGGLVVLERNDRELRLWREDDLWAVDADGYLFGWDTDPVAVAMRWAVETV